MSDQTGDGPDGPGPLHLEFCGEWRPVPPPGPFTIGREGDLAVDDNPYLHRLFLELRWRDLWWVANVGSQLAATVVDADSRVQAWLGPQASIPLVFGTTVVRFSAGRTSYELVLHLSDPPMAVTEVAATSGDGTTTIGRLSLTQDQRLLVLALAEPALLAAGPQASALPASAEAADRLGWALTKFNRKLDNVCQKLAKAGVQGLHGGPDRLASGRRARLVEYALAVRLVTSDDLPLLDQARPPEP